MPTVKLAASPHALEIHPVKIHYRQFGSGPPLVFLHSGWGYGVYPFDKQIETFRRQFRTLIPDRSGYGRSTHPTGELPLDFHWRAASETMAFLDKLGVQKAVLWGHSDGAVIAAIMGIQYQGRCQSLILEAVHFLKRKPRSRLFFERFAARPGDLGEDTRRLLVRDHGAKYWKTAVQRNCDVWIRMADSVSQQHEDVYEGRLGELNTPTLVLHGRHDPRTEPGEIELLRAAARQSKVLFIENGKHSPHSEEAAFKECNEAVQDFLSSFIRDRSGQKLKN